MPSITAKELAARGDIDALRAFIGGGGDIRAEKDYALSTAAEHGYTDIVKLLLENGCQATTNDSAPLRWAVFNFQAEAAEILIQHGANPWCQNGKLYKFLHGTYDNHRMKGIVNLEFKKTEQVMAPHKTTFPVGEKDYYSFKRRGFIRRQTDNDKFFIAKAFIYATDREDFQTVMDILDALGENQDIFGSISRFYRIAFSILDRRVGKPSGLFRNADRTRRIIEEMARW